MKPNRNATIPAFNSRETYLAWRAAWRMEYAKNSKTIRHLRHLLAELHRASAGKEAKNLDTLMAGAIRDQVLLPGHTTTGHCQYQLMLHRHLARQLMKARTESKVLAQQQFVAEHATAA